MTVSTQPECEWTAAAESAWITELTPAQGQGSGQVQFQVGSNPNGTARESAVAINGQRALVRQDASPCNLVVDVNETQFPTSGGAGTITVTGPGGCVWTAASSVSWISVPSASGSGSGNLGFTVALNTGGERTGTITAGGTAIDITQAGAAGPTPPPPCTVSSINPTSQAISAAAAIGIGVTVSAAPGCTWTATSNTVAWLTIASGASGNGNGIVMVNAAANTGSARVGTATIGGRTFTVNQAAGSSCTYSINPTSRSATAAAATGLTVAVSTSAGCTWTASSNNPAWLTITAGASGTGNGTVTYNVAANTAGARSGTLTIAGQTFTVNQAATCTYSINPTSITVGDREVTGLTVAVSAPAACAWTATSNVGFVDITAGSSGNGSGTVTYRVQNFNGSTRTGTMTIAGQTFTVTQVQCTATLNPPTQAVGALGGSFTVAVTTQLGCPWQAVESLTWVTITSGNSGAGGGTVGYTVAPNLAGARSGTVAIAGQTLTVNQAAVIP